MKKPKLGTGARFKALTKKLATKGAKSPKALAASIGRKKYGAKKMAMMEMKGKKMPMMEMKAKKMSKMGMK